MQARRPSSRAVGVALGALALGIAAVAGCGSERPPVQSDGTTARAGGVGGGGGASQFSSDAGALKPPGCGVKADGSACDCVDVPLFNDAPTMYFVLDRSGSMQTGDRWMQIRIVVGKIMRSLGPRANFGATMFPARTEACAPGEEVMPVRNGDPPSSTLDGPTTSTLLAVTAVAPSGGTPTAATLEKVRANLAGIGRAFVILATDGAPNCNRAAVCGLDQCQPNIEGFGGCTKDGPVNCCEPPDWDRANCNDAAPTIAAIAALKAAQIPVFVVGLSTVDLYRSLLDQMATAGGMALPTSPKYIAVDAANEAAMLVALRKVAAKITGTCSFNLQKEPVDPGLVNVYIDDAVVPYEPANGWSITGKTVTLLGSSCESVKSGDALNVRIISGCPRIEPR